METTHTAGDFKNLQLLKKIGIKTVHLEYIILRRTTEVLKALPQELELLLKFHKVHGLSLSP